MLDAVLPGGGWPRRGLVEVLVPASGYGELRLWAPLVAHLSQLPAARWCTFIAPPFEPYAPAWQWRGARVDRLLVVRTASAGRTHDAPWAMEQGLLSGACALVFGWVDHLGMRELRRLALAADKGAALGVLVRSSRAMGEHTAAQLRLLLEAGNGRLRLQLLKGRGVMPRCVELALP